MDLKKDLCFMLILIIFVLIYFFIDYFIDKFFQKKDIKISFRVKRVLCIVLVYFLIFLLSFFISIPNPQYEQGIECCLNKVNGIQDGDYCVFKGLYMTERVHLSTLGRENTMDHQIYCKRNKKLLQKQLPYSWQDWVDEE